MWFWTFRVIVSFIVSVGILKGVCVCKYGSEIQEKSGLEKQIRRAIGVEMVIEVVGAVGFV